MLLVVDGQPRGIRCDLTGREQFDKFTYYSLEGKLVAVDTNRKIVNRDQETTLDLDLCEAAYNDLYERVKVNLGQAKVGAVKCDLSAKYLTGIFQYWAASIAQVQVDLERQEPMSISKGIFDLNVSQEEVFKLIQMRDANRARPFLTPKQVPKKEPPTASPPPTPTVVPVVPVVPKVEKAVITEPEVELEPQEIVRPKTHRNIKKKP